MKAADWIRVSDRLPENIDGRADSDWVLVYIQEEDVPDVPNIGIMYYHHARKVWYDVADNYFTSVTHWMPIVSPPKEDRI